MILLWWHAGQSIWRLWSTLLWMGCACRCLAEWAYILCLPGCLLWLANSGTFYAPQVLPKWSPCAYCYQLTAYCTHTHTHTLKDNQCTYQSISRLFFQYIITIGVTCDTPLSPTNGAVNYFSTEQGSTATYQCDSGYVLGGSPTATCGIDGEWSHTPPHCSGKLSRNQHPLSRTPTILSIINPLQLSLVAISYNQEMAESKCLE